MVEEEIWWNCEKIIFETYCLTTNLKRIYLSINRNDEMFF